MFRYRHGTGEWSQNISRGLPANEGVGRSFVRSVVVGGGEQIFWFLNKCANGTYYTVEIIPL